MALKEIIVETQASLRADAANAKAVFSVDSRQVENLRSEARIRQFSLTVDEPPSLGGSDAGPNPVELILAGLATCQEITYRAYATALGVPLESVSVKLDGVLDLRGFFAVDERVRSGFTGVRGTVTLKSSASKEEWRSSKRLWTRTARSWTSFALLFPSSSSSTPYRSPSPPEAHLVRSGRRSPGPACHPTV
jgi:putative redox protein